MSRGGARKGAGRPRGENTERVTAFVSPATAALVDRLCAVLACTRGELLARAVEALESGLPRTMRGGKVE